MAYGANCAEAERAVSARSTAVASRKSLVAQVFMGSPISRLPFGGCGLGGGGDEGGSWGGVLWRAKATALNAKVAEGAKVREGRQEQRRGWFRSYFPLMTMELS